MPLGQVLFLQAPIFLNAHAITTIENIFILTATETNEKLGSRHRFYDHIFQISFLGLNHVIRKCSGYTGMYFGIG